MTLHFKTAIRLAGARATSVPIHNTLDHPDLFAVIVVFLVTLRAGLGLGLVHRMVLWRASFTVLE